jgi:NADH-quinone oxidoreductase subunit J
MNLAQVFFSLCAAGTLLGAIAAVASKNPIRGALGLMVMILGIAALYLGLGAQFLAAIQLIVYAGAVVVLFLFVIMLLGPDATSITDTRGLFPRLLAGTLFALMGGGAITLTIASSKAHRIPRIDGEFGGVDAFGRELFSDGIVPFELSSALLMVSVIGAIAIARGKRGGLPSETSEIREVAIAKDDRVPLVAQAAGTSIEDHG